MKHIERIPAKYRERVAEIEDDREEENGWWIYLKDALPQRVLMRKIEELYGAPTKEKADEA